jgi:pilus assembly protein CpaC
MSKKLQTALAAVLSVAIAGTPTVGYAQAAETPTLTITQGGDNANAASLILPLNKAAIIDLPYDARDILLSNPSIADAVVRTSRRVYVIGRALGQTNAFFFDAQGRQIANIEIRVEPDVAPLNDLLRRHAPESGARAEAVNGSLVLTGSVRSASEAERVLQIATRFITATGAAGGSAGGANAAAGAGGGAAQPAPIVNLLQVEGSEQVMVRVRIVEMSRTLVRQLGVNVNAQNMLNALVPEDVMVEIATQNGFSIAGRALGGLQASAGVVDTILRPESVVFPGPNASTQSPTVAGVGGYEFDNGGTADPIDDVVTNGPGVTEPSSQVDASIEAFERAGLLRVLAEPNITAISGEASRFLAGGEFPVPVASEDGELSIEFKPYGVGLAVTPIVLSGGRISLKLSTEVSELTSEGAINTGDTVVPGPNNTSQVVRGITIPALQVRRAETTVEMPSGGALVLAGLIQERTRHAIEGIPGAMDSPILGPLFRSRDFINNETELVIIVTPYLVRPTSPDRLRTPADGFANPSERESILMGRLNALYRTPTDPNGEPRRLQGPHGHIIQ